MAPIAPAENGMVAETGYGNHPHGDSFVEIDWRLVANDRPLSVAEQIAERISQAILIGEYRPGQRIPEQSIADLYQVSRGPVREALRLLEREGVIEILPRRGAQVTSLTVKEVNDIFNIRAGLLGMSVRLLIENIQPEHIEQLKSRVARLSRICSDPEATEEYLSISFGLSLFIGRNSDNERLYELVRSLSRQTIRYTALGLSSPVRRQRSAKIWRSMLKAIQKGDCDAAESACRTLVEESRNSAIKHLSAPPDRQENEAV